MDEPWYEAMEISFTEVRDIFEKEYKEKVPNKESLKEIINTVVPDNVSFGSYRGYYTFLHPVYKKKIEDLINQIIK